MESYVLAPANFSDIPDIRLEAHGALRRKQGPVSEAFAIAVPDERQLAYNGYKENIDIFLAATARNEKFVCTIPGLEVEIAQYTFPLDGPRTLISIKDDVPSSLYDKILSGIKKASEVTVLSKLKNHPRCFVIEQPRYNMILSLTPFVKEVSPRIEGTSKYGDAKAFFTVAFFVDLYLRTNTYPAFRSDEDSKNLPQHSISSNKNGRPAAWLNNEGLEWPDRKKMRYTTVSMTHDGKKKEKEEGLWFGPASDADVSMPELQDYVLFAKPSPAKDSTASWSSPTNAPNLPGIVFPYWVGMNSSDAMFVKNMIASHFVRLLGTDPKENLISLRQHVGGFTSTASGIALTHILKGIELSLQAQGQLHLLFDHKMYLGFVVFGAKWSLVTPSKVYPAASAVALTATLSKMRTHGSSLAELRTLLETDFGMLIDNDFEDGWDVAEILARVEFSANSEKRRSEERQLEDLVYNLDFGTKAELITGPAILSAMEDMSLIPTSLPSNQHVHFPPARLYNLFSNTDALILSRFGAKVPSLIVPSVKSAIGLSASMSEDTDEGRAARAKVDRIFVGLKPIDSAVKDWVSWRENPQVISAVTERGGPYRHITLTSRAKDDFLLGGAGRFADHLRVVKRSQKALGKRKEREEDQVENDYSEYDNVAFEF